MQSPPSKRLRQTQRPKPFQPAIGSDFGTVDEVDAKTRSFLAKFIASSLAIVVGITGSYGLITGNYVAVIGVWSVAGPVFGAVVTYYFGPQRNDTG